MTTILVGGAVIWFLFGVFGAWAYDHLVRKPSAPVESITSADSPAGDAPPAPGAADLDPLKARLGELGEKVEDFEKQIDEAAKPAAPADLAPLRQRVEDVAKSVDQIATDSKQLQTLNSRMEGLETSITGLKGDLGSLQANAEPPANRAGTTTPPTETAATDTAKPATTEAMKTDDARPAPALEKLDVNDQNGAFAQGVSLFKAGKYEDAYQVFEKLETSHPNDARVWYYAALSHGWARDKFKDGGKTAALLQKGIELEKAGTPKSTDIDAALRGVTSASGKVWLDFKRKQGLK